MGAGGGGDTGYSGPGSGLSNTSRGKAISKITDSKPILSKSKGVQYKSGAVSDKIFAISKDISTTGAMPIPRVLKITNDGGTPIMIMSGYETFSNVGVSAGSVKYLHSLVMPGENIILPVRAVISEHTSAHILDGTAVDNATPAAALKAALASQIDGSGLASSTTATTFNVDDNAGSPAATTGFYRINDKIRIDDEIMKVTAIAENTGTEAQLTVERGVDSSTAATHADDAVVHLAFHNGYQKFDKYSTVRTDSLGKYKSTNMFGVGRVNGVAVGTLQGITPGSFAMKFYTEGGWQSLGLSGINNGTKTGLSASTTYRLNVAVDGGSEFSDLEFTTDATNTRFGGKNGLVEKLQDAFDTQFYTAGHLFEKKVNVGIVEGDLRFSSGSNLSTSAIALAIPDGSSNFFGVGRIPAVTALETEAARLPDDLTYDNVSYSTNPNTQAFAYDDGQGNILGAARGTINYETGGIDITGPKDAEFVYTVIHSGAFSGKLDSEDTHKNALVAVYANTPSQKWNGSVLVEGW